MNKFVTAIKSLDIDAVRDLVENDAKWIEWAEKEGKNALHFLCGVPMIEMRPGRMTIPVHDEAERRSLQILKLFLRRGMDINSVHRIPDKLCGYFPGTPVWYAYTRGRNETLYKYLLKEGADPRHCMYAITWYDDTTAAALFKKYGAFAQNRPRNQATKPDYSEDINGPKGMDSPLLAAFAWRKWKMAEWLLKNGANPNTEDNRGCTPLFHAVRKKYDADRIKLLLKFRADPDHSTSTGLTPRSLAAKYRDKAIFELFKSVR